MREDLYRALDQRLQDIRSIHWGRGFQLAGEDDRRRCIEHVWSLIEPALEMANLDIVSTLSNPGAVWAYDWQHDRELPGMWEKSDLIGGETDSEKDSDTARRDNQVDTKDGKPRTNRLFQNGIC